MNTYGHSKISKSDIEHMAKTLFDVKYGTLGLKWDDYRWLSHEAKDWCLTVTEKMVTELEKEKEKNETRNI